MTILNALQIVLMAGIGALGIGLLVFWVWMLVDCLHALSSASGCDENHILWLNVFGAADGTCEPPADGRRALLETLSAT